MEIFNFNISDNREDVISALVDVYYDNPELFEDEAYCHFDVDDLTGDIYVFNNTREAEYACACDYILDDDDNIPEDDIRDCVEYFYNEMVDKAEERTSMAKRNGHFIYGESKNRLRLRIRDNRNIKEAVHSKTNTIDIITNFFEQQGWNVNDPEVQNYIDGVYNLLIQDPEWIDGTYTMDDWYLDTKVNFPSDIDWLDHTAWGY